jgi:hypothetical protein
MRVFGATGFIGTAIMKRTTIEREGSPGRGEEGRRVLF